MAHVLLIDDELDGRDAVAAYLARAGHAVTCARSAREALTAHAERVPDAIFLDVRMPDVDGLAVLQLIRSYLRWATPPVAILTAYPEDPRLSNVFDYGVARVFTKSKVLLEELLQWVNEQAGRPLPRPDVPPPEAGGSEGQYR